MVKKGIMIFSTMPSIISTGVTVGPLEKESPLSSYFDKIYEDERIELKTNEQGHAKLMEDACMIALSKAGKVPSDADYLILGDLVNQMTPSNFCASSLQIPYIGMFSACATSVSSILTAALLTEVNFSTHAVAGAASQHNAIERQFRYPVEYGSQKPKTAQWTATAAGVAVVGPHQTGVPSIAKGTIGKAIDLGMTDPLNMGAAMAPAAMDTLVRHLKAHGTSENEYDLIMTGDLGETGFAIFKELAKRNEITIGSHFKDAGIEFYGQDKSFQAGASGAGCSAATYYSYVYNEMMKGTYKRVLLIATGALLSPLSVQQGETIPCTAHAVELIMK